nr:hypothetical protein [Massilia putida]
MTLAVAFGEQVFELRVRDDGRGITQAPGPGHWGLAGMRERAAAIGGQLDIGQAPGGGTLVALAVPAGQAYERPPRQPWWRRPARGVPAGQPSSFRLCICVLTAAIMLRSLSRNDMRLTYQRTTP